jgi:hypothetical protein
MPKNEGMTVGELRAKLKEYDPNTPIYIGTWVDRNPGDSGDTDLSCYEPEPMKPTDMIHRKQTWGFRRRVDKVHLYISPGTM